MNVRMAPRPKAFRSTNERRRYTQSMGAGVVRFQEASNAFDDVAAEILAVDRADLPCMTMLLFQGTATIDELAAALHVGRAAVVTTLERLQSAGYARCRPGGRARIELTERARIWIERIWAPLQQGGARLMERYPTRQLAVIASFLHQACEIQDARTRELRTWLRVPSPQDRHATVRGGLSPAALRRVQLFVEANLGRPIQLRDLAARAALSPYHFSRAFKTSAGMTPRAFVEYCRVERAKHLLTESTQPVVEVAAETGLGTQSRLTTTFKRRTGITPAAYRRRRDG
jgi:AraC family transcriptional regulator